MGVLNTLMDKLHKKEDLEKEILDLDNDIRMIEKKLTPEEVENMSYEKFKWLWNKIEYGVVRPKRAEFEEILERKREEKYPELKRAVYFSDINQLDIPDEDKKRIDRALTDNYRYVISADRIRSGAIAGLKVEELETLHKIGVLEKFVSFYIFGKCCCTYSENELKKYFRFWELDKNFQRLNKIEKHEWSTLLDEYECIYFENTEGEFEELMNRTEYNLYDEKEIIYKVNLEKMDKHWNNV